MKRLVYLTYLTASLTFGALANDRSSRIINGEDASSIDYPYMLFFYHVSALYGGTMCAATIISEQWAITAAHCVAHIPGRELRLHANLTDFEFADSIELGVVEMIVHPFSKVWGNSADYDIALLKVFPHFSFGTGIQPIGLPGDDQETEPGEEGIITGWGQATDDGVAGPSEVLQVGTVSMLSQASCTETYANAPYAVRGKVTSRMICAQGDSSACKGDSGGPLVVNDQVIGIVSWGAERCQDYPTVFTRVAFFRRWIRIMTGV